MAIHCLGYIHALMYLEHKFTVSNRSTECFEVSGLDHDMSGCLLLRTRSLS